MCHIKNTIAHKTANVKLQENSPAASYSICRSNWSKTSKVELSVSLNDPHGPQNNFWFPLYILYPIKSTIAHKTANVKMQKKSPVSSYSIFQSKCSKTFIVELAVSLNDPRDPQNNSWFPLQIMYSTKSTIAHKTANVKLQKKSPVSSYSIFQSKSSKTSKVELSKSINRPSWPPK